MRLDGVSKRRGLRTKSWGTPALKSQRNYQKLGKERIREKRRVLEDQPATPKSLSQTKEGC